MAQELREGDGKSGIARAGKRKWGYDPAQVDAFLERAHALYDSEGMISPSMTFRTCPLICARTAM